MVFRQGIWCFGSVMSPRHLSSQRNKPFESESSKTFSSRVRVESWIGRVKVKSQELSSHYESSVCKLESMSSHMTFLFFSYKMAPNEHQIALNQQKNGVQCCFSNFCFRVFGSKFFLKQFRFYFSPSLSVISTSLAQLYYNNEFPCLSHAQKWPKMNMHLDLDLNLAAF